MSENILPTTNYWADQVRLINWEFWKGSWLGMLKRTIFQNDHLIFNYSVFPPGQQQHRLTSILSAGIQYFYDLLFVSWWLENTFTPRTCGHHWRAERTQIRQRNCCRTCKLIFDVSNQESWFSGQRIVVLPPRAPTTHDPQPTTHDPQPSTHISLLSCI